jgi:murein DD-endopeptidase MepM/ murein hydrolase activator NlpD
LGSITTPYGGSTKWEDFHPAVDVANKIGTPIPSYSAGKVIAVEQGHKQGDKGFGNYAIVQDAQGNKWRYSHLKASYVKVGDQLGKGQVIGEMGNTGSTYSNSGGTGSHLDLRVVDAYNRAVNPNKLISRV